MKKILILLLILAILSFSGIRVVYGMTDIKNIPQPKTYVAEVLGEASYKKAGSIEWINIEKNQELFAGDTVKTGKNGKVSINFFDNSIAHIGPDSEVTISENQIDKNNYSKINVKLFVIVGRVWSRIIQLSDKEATYEVGSNNTVATVRGTIFDYIVDQVGATQVSSVENAVAISAIEFKEEVDQSTGQKKAVRTVVKTLNLLPDKEIKIEKDLEKNQIKEPEIISISEIEKTSGWYRANQEADKKIEEQIKEKQAEISRQTAGILPDSKLYAIKQLAEKTRVMLASDSNQKNELEAAFLGRRLAEGHALVEIGKVGLAEEVMQKFSSGLDNLMNNLKQDEASQNIKSQINNQISLQKNLLDQILPDETAYSVKKSLENFEQKIANEDDKNYLIYLQAKERLKEAEALKAEGKIDLYEKIIKEFQIKENELNQINTNDLKDRLNIIKDQIEKAPVAPITEINKEIEVIKSEETKPTTNETAAVIDQPKDQPTTTEKPVVQTNEPVQATPLKPVIEEAEKPIVPAPVTPAPQVPVRNVTPPPPPPPPSEPVKVTLTKLKIVAGKYNIIAKTGEQLKAVATYSDGSTKNVTASVRWSLDGDIGLIFPGGYLQSDEDGGSGTVSASYAEDGITVSDISSTFTALTII